MILSSSGIGILLSAMAIQYRDIRHAILFITQLLMYSAPVVWPLSLVKEKFGETVYFWYGLYPMVGVIEGFRSALLGTNDMPMQAIILGSVSSVLIFLVAVKYFKLRENIFADVA